MLHVFTTRSLPLAPTTVEGPSSLTVSANRCTFQKGLSITIPSSAPPPGMNPLVRILIYGSTFLSTNTEDPPFTANAATAGGSQGLTNAVVWVGYGVLAVGAAGTALSLARALVNAAPGAFGTAAAERRAVQRPDRDGGGWGWEEGGTSARLTFDLSVDGGMGGAMGGAASLLLGIGAAADSPNAVQLPAENSGARMSEHHGRDDLVGTPLLLATSEPSEGDDESGDVELCELIEAIPLPHKQDSCYRKKASMGVISPAALGLSWMCSWRGWRLAQL